MDFSSTYLVSKKRKKASRTEVAKAEASLGARFPDGYREFVTTLGEGLYCGFVRVQMPKQIVKDRREFRDRVTKHYFWDKGKDVLPQQRVVESIRIADTIVGDELIFHPDAPGHLYVLPRESETIFDAGSTIHEAIEWMCRSGKLARPIGFPYFDSQIDQVKTTLACITQRPPLAKFRKALEALGLHDRLEDASEGGETHLTLFLGSIGGYLSCMGIKSKYDVCIWHDRECQEAPLLTLLARLDDFGFLRPFELKGRLHPKLAKLRSKYFRLEGVVPSPTPAAQRTPEQVVFGYLKGMCIRETGMARLSIDGLPLALGEGIAEQVIREFCTPGRHAYNGQFGVVGGDRQKPSPTHDSKRETIVESRQESPDQIRIMTRSKKSDLDLVDGLEFLLKRVEGAWRLHRVWAIATTFGPERERLL